MTVKFKICGDAGYNCFKSNAPNLNMLLPVMNERIFYNNGVANEIPLLGLIAASNELPEDEGLEAIYDRFLFKIDIKNIQKLSNIEKMLTNEANNVIQKNKTMISIQEIQDLQKKVNSIKVSSSIIDNFIELLTKLENELGITISDRKKNQCIKILKANALLNQREEVTLHDFEGLVCALKPIYDKDEFSEAQIKQNDDEFMNIMKEFFIKYQLIYEKLNKTFEDEIVKKNSSTIDAGMIDFKAINKMLKEIKKLISVCNQIKEPIGEKLEELYKKVLDYKTKAISDIK